MAKKVVVSSAQRSAARAMVRRSSVTGRYVSDSVRKIADAKPVNGVARQAPRAPATGTAAP